MRRLAHWMWETTRRLARWLWRYRWPGCPLTIAGLLTLAQFAYDPQRSSWIDKAIVLLVVGTLLRIWYTIVRKTPRPWNDMSTGVFLLISAEIVMYGVLLSPASFGIRVPHLRTCLYALRSLLLVSSVVLMLAYRERDDA